MYTHVDISSSILGSFLLFSVAKQGPMVLAEGNGVAGGRTGQHRDLVAPKKTCQKYRGKLDMGKTSPNEHSGNTFGIFFWGVPLDYSDVERLVSTDHGPFAALGS